MTTEIQSDGSNVLRALYEADLIPDECVTVSLVIGPDKVPQLHYVVNMLPNSLEDFGVALVNVANPEQMSERAEERREAAEEYERLREVEKRLEHVELALQTAGRQTHDLKLAVDSWRYMVEHADEVDDGGQSVHRAQIERLALTQCIRDVERVFGAIVKPTPVAESAVKP